VIKNGAVEILKKGEENKFEVINKMRNKALQGWISDGMERVIGDVKNAGEVPVNRIHLGARRKIVDARYQCKVETVRDMPQTINQSELVQLLTWNLWRVMRERNMVAGFTRYIAKRPLSSTVCNGNLAFWSRQKK
jgi:hypothetical protein